MKIVPFLFATTLVAWTGCSGSKAKLREQEAYIRGQQQAIAAQQQAQQPAVWVRGLVRNPRVPWTENLTLAQALVAAQYTGMTDPGSIRIIRQGRAYQIDPKRLVRGLEDPPLEAGDLIELGR